MLSKLKIIIAVAVLAACGNSGPVPIDRTKTVVRGVNFVGVTVSDLDQAEAFYEAGAALETVQNGAQDNTPLWNNLLGREGSKSETRMMRSVNSQLRLMQFENPSSAASSALPVPVNGPGIAHVCYQVAKSTGAYETFLANGATHIGDRDMVQLNARNPVEYAYITDPDGMVIEVEHVDIAALDLPEPPAHEHRIRHVSLGTPNMGRAVKFYSRLLEEPKPRRAGRLFSFGNETVDRVSGLEGTKIKMSWFQLRNLELEIIQYTSHPTETPETPRPVDALGYNMIVFDVSSIEAAREKLLYAGGIVVGDVEPLDGGEILFGRDPDGNLLGFQVVADDAVVSSQNFENDGT